MRRHPALKEYQSGREAVLIRQPLRSRVMQFSTHAACFLLKPVERRMFVNVRATALMTDSPWTRYAADHDSGHPLNHFQNALKRYAMTQPPDPLMDTALDASRESSRPDDTRWLTVTLAPSQQTLGRFTLDTWVISRIAPADHGETTPRTPDQAAQPEPQRTLPLQLHLTERTDYRYNLRCEQPRLFVLCEEREADGMQPRVVTACQEVASHWLDGDQLVLDTPMPPALMVWLEGYLARHGERIDEGKKKKRKGAGRASQTDTVHPDADAANKEGS